MPFISKGQLYLALQTLGEIGRVPNTVRMYQSGEPHTAELDMCQESHDALWWTLEGALVLRQ